MRGDESRADEAVRITLLTRLFLALGIEGEAERLAAWSDAVRALNTAQLELRCRVLTRTWQRAGAPRPADLLAAIEASPGTTGRTKPSVWIDGTHRVTGETVMGDQDRARRYRQLGSPCVWDTSDEARAIRARRSEMSLADDVARIRERRLREAR